MEKLENLKCPECDKIYKNFNGLKGHYWPKHHPGKPQNNKFLRNLLKKEDANLGENKAETKDTALNDLTKKIDQIINMAVPEGDLPKDISKRLDNLETNICKQFPALCSKVDTLDNKINEIGIKLSTEGDNHSFRDEMNTLNTKLNEISKSLEKSEKLLHRNIDEDLDCPECRKVIINKIVKRLKNDSTKDQFKPLIEEVLNEAKDRSGSTLSGGNDKESQGEEGDISTKRGRGDTSKREQGSPGDTPKERKRRLYLRKT